MAHIYKLHNTECLAFMREMESASVDVIITDPPYGLGIAGNPIRQKFERQKWDDEIPMPEVFEQMFRVSKNQIIWGGNYYQLPPHKNFLVWDKYQPEKFTLAMVEMAWSSFDMPAKIFRYSVQREGANIHPTQKPVALMKWCIEKFTEPNQIIFDPFMGSGTTGVAALQTGRRFIGCEIEPEYFAIAERRISQAALQPVLLARNPTKRAVDGGDSSRQQALFTPEDLSAGEG